MDLFAKFKTSLRQSLARLRRPEDPALELLRAVEEARDWTQLELRLRQQQTISRRRQQEALEQLEPLAQKVEGLIAQAKAAKVKVIKQNLLRQADDYLHELEAMDEPAKVYSANVRMLTNILKQVRRASAMQASALSAEAVDSITSRIEGFVVEYESATEAVRELEEAGKLDVGGELSEADLSKRVAQLYDSGGDATAAQDADDRDTESLEGRLYDA